MALALLFNPKYGRVFGTGPTHASVTNCAIRVHQRGTLVVESYIDKNKDKDIRRPCVVRGFRWKDELKAFRNILETGVADDNAAGKKSSWTLALSVTNWLLAVCRSRALEESQAPNIVKTIQPYDQESLHKLQAEIDGDDLADFRRLVRKEISWADCFGQNDGPMLMRIGKWMRQIVNNTTAFFTTPAGAKFEGYTRLTEGATAVVVDEAGCMNIADLCSVWGPATGRPLVAAGDIRQLDPAVMEMKNRFREQMKVSALAFLQASGLPVYRMRVQIRMCNDMFGLAGKLAYSDMKMSYHPLSDPSQSHHALGRLWEEWLLDVRQYPSLRRSKTGTLQPVFMHTPGTRAYREGTSKLNRLQVRYTLGVLSDFVQWGNIDPAEIVIMAPYKANVVYGNRLLQVSMFPALDGIMPIQTADTFQGREGKMAAVIFGTTQKSGPGFTSSEARLNVMITRQQCALLLVGDKNVVGALEGKDRPKSNVQNKYTRVYGPDGQAEFGKPRMLYGMLKHLNDSGRIFEYGTQANDQSNTDADDNEDKTEAPVDDTGISVTNDDEDIDDKDIDDVDIDDEDIDDEDGVGKDDVNEVTNGGEVVADIDVGEVNVGEEGVDKVNVREADAGVVDVGDLNGGDIEGAQGKEEKEVQPSAGEIEDTEVVTVKDTEAMMESDTKQSVEETEKTAECDSSPAFQVDYDMDF